MGAGSNADGSNGGAVMSATGSGASWRRGRPDEREPRRREGPRCLPLCADECVEWVFTRSLTCAEGDDAADRIVGRNPDGHAVAGNDLDAETTHAAAQLCKHLMAGIALHAVKPAGMYRHDRSLHINEIVLAQ